MEFIGVCFDIQISDAVSHVISIEALNAGDKILEHQTPRHGAIQFTPQYTAVPKF